jgi:hypothetical protein
MIAVSMRLNFIFGTSLGQTPEKAWVFGLVSVGADAWKGLGPIFIIALWRARRWGAWSAAGLLWLPCLLFSMTSAIGIAISDRTTVVGGREAAQANYEQARLETEEIETKRKALPTHRSVGEIEAELNGVLARPVASGQRIRGTVGSISLACGRADARTAEACGQVVQLRQELAAAVEAVRLETRLAELRPRLDAFRTRGAAQSTDPQAELISRLMFGWISARDIAPGLALLLALVVEVISAFGPVVVAAYADATRVPNLRQIGETRTVATGRGLSQQAATRRGAQEVVVEYMAERLAPAGENHGIGADEIFGDYIGWCKGKRYASLGLDDFLAEFDRKRREHDLEGQIRKFGNRYFGIRLSPLLLTT